jgi:hypothetical protein
MTSRSGSDGRDQTGTIWGVRPLAWFVLSLIVVMTIILLRFEGRRWWCQSGDLSLWSSGIHSQHTSQHFIDPYSFTGSGDSAANRKWSRRCGGLAGSWSAATRGEQESLEAGRWPG